MNLETKPTLKYYKEGKKKIGYESCYRNNTNSMFLARARVNSLKLEDAKGRGIPSYNKTCKLCNMEEENIVHFTMVCPMLQGIRNKSELIKKDISDPKDRMIEMLFRQKEYQKAGELIRCLWNKRKQILDYKTKEKERQERMKDNINSVRSDPGPINNGRILTKRRTQSMTVARG